MQMGASSVQLQVAPSAPGIFAAATAGDGIIVLYATGCGALTNDDLLRCALPVSVTVNGERAQVLACTTVAGLGLAPAPPVRLPSMRARLSGVRDAS
jgi:hypothetical protein